MFIKVHLTLRIFRSWMLSTKVLHLPKASSTRAWSVTKASSTTPSTVPKPWMTATQTFYPLTIPSSEGPIWSGWPTPRQPYRYRARISNCWETPSSLRASHPRAKWGTSELPSRTPSAHPLPPSWMMSLSLSLTTVSWSWLNQANE